MGMVRLFKKMRGFVWDAANNDKNWLKHKVANRQAEEVLLNPGNVIVNDSQHSKQEKRYIAIGSTEKGLMFSVVFTLRTGYIRVISARPASRKERIIYEKTVKNS